MIPNGQCRATAAEIKYDREVAGKSRRDRVKNERIRGDLGITSLRGSVEKRQLRWFGDLCRMDEDCDLKMFFEGKPTECHLSERPDYYGRNTPPRLPKRKVNP